MLIRGFSRGGMSACTEPATSASAASYSAGARGLICSSNQLRDGFAAGLAQTLAEDATVHRLWYALRTQSLFEESFRQDVHDIDQSLERMIWRIVSRYAELSGAVPYLSSAPTYAVLDGLFQQSLLTQLSGRDDSAGQLRSNVGQVLDRLVIDR